MKNINASSLIKYALFLTLVFLSYFSYSYFQSSTSNVPSTEEIKAIVEETTKDLPPNEGVSLGYAIVRAPFSPPPPDPDNDNTQIELFCTFLGLISATAILNQVRKKCSIRGRGKPREYFPKIFCLSSNLFLLYSSRSFTV